LLDDLRGAVRRFLDEQGFLLASALSFAFVLCLLPLTLILLSVAGFLLESDAVAEYLFDTVTLLFPAYGAQLVEFLVLLITERAVTGVLGAAGLLVFASQLFSLTRSVMNRAFRAGVPRGLIHGFAFDLLAVLLGSALVVGFALETADGERRARRKLVAKNADYMVLNDDSALNAERATVTILGRDGTSRRLENRSKAAIARALVGLAAPRGDGR